jgi:hypothetical protein
MNMTPNALDGTLVISLEQAVAAPYCARLLAEAGARIIKIEREEGDFARHYDSVVNGESAFFVWLNAGKESIVLDVKNEDDMDLMRNMLASADVFIQNIRPGAVERPAEVEGDLAGGIRLDHLGDPIGGDRLTDQPFRFVRDDEIPTDPLEVAARGER